MKKFLIKICICLAVFALVVLAANLCYLRLVEEDYVIKNVPMHIQICNFGSSHGQAGFNYEKFKGKYVCFNFALAGQTPEYDYRILQHYKDKIDPGAAVFLSISYFSFFGRPEVEELGFLSMNRRYYRFLPRELIPQYDWKTDIYVNYLPCLLPEGLPNLVKAIAGNKESVYETLKSNHEAIKKSAAGRYIHHIRDNLNKDGTRQYKHAAIEAMYNMINLCRQIGAKPMLVTVPYADEYTDMIKKNDPAFFDDFYGVIEEIKRKTGVDYYDYAFDERLCRSYALFMDSDHLNIDGGRVFTDIILCEVLSVDVQ